MLLSSLYCVVELTGYGLFLLQPSSLLEANRAEGWEHTLH